MNGPYNKLFYVLTFQSGCIVQTSFLLLLCRKLLLQTPSISHKKKKRKYKFLLFPMREFPDESRRAVQMRLYLRHGLPRQGCNYKIHNPYELVLRASSGQLASQLGCKLAIEQAVRATLLNSKKTREDALYRGITTETRRWRWVGATVNGAAVGG